MKFHRTGEILGSIFEIFSVEIVSFFELFKSLEIGIISRSSKKSVDFLFDVAMRLNILIDSIFLFFSHSHLGDSGTILFKDHNLRILILFLF